jgi:hypothetical protein
MHVEGYGHMRIAIETGHLLMLTTASEVMRSLRAAKWLPPSRLRSRSISSATLVRS